MKQIFTLTVFIALLGLTSSVYAQDFQTGSDIMNSGSAYSSSVSAVGAEQVDEMAPTTYSTRVMRRGDDDWGENQNPGYGGVDSPIGEPLVLLFFAAVAAAVISLRIRKERASATAK